MAPPDPNDPDEDPAHPGFGYGVAKKKLFRVINREIAPARARYEALMADRAGLEKVLEEGARRARAVARGVLARVRAKTGLPLVE
jgi:tryptophanyl-tRNA synthetase